MSQAPEIVDLAKVVDPYLEGGHLVSYSSRYLTKPGENYGSIMLAITANVRKPSGEIEEMPLIAKLPPITNDFYWQIFHPQRTCITENATYRYLGPALRALQLDAGIDADEIFDGFPRYYGSRISLQPDAEIVDRDAVLVQENLQTSGFKAGDRHKMFDYAHTCLVLEHMAKYHALPIALRLKKPSVFDELVRPYYHRFNMNNTMGPEVQEQMRIETFKEIALATNNNDNAVERIEKLFEEYNRFLDLPTASDGIFTSIVHCDMWINNLMIQYDENGAPSNLKIVDFQIAQYESVLHDVIFFLFSSVEANTLEEHYEEFLQIYYQAFVECLERLKISTAEYSYQAFLDEVRRVAPLEIPHAIFMTKIILADNSTMPEDYKDMSLDVMSKNQGVAEISQKTGDIIRLAEKLKYL